MQLLSNELYADRTVFMRELIQNSVDATRAQMIRDRRAGLVSVPERFTDEEPWNWPQELTADPRYEITLRESVVDNKGETCVVFSVSDNGIGMSLSDIQEFFLQVGKSFYTTDQFQREFRHTPISRFGIGFLSCLSVADHIEVTTRHRDESVGMKLDIRPPSDFFVITPDAEAEFGTTVTLRIRPIVLEELKERRVPYGEIDIIAGSDNNLTTMCMGWGIFIEFALATEYGRIVPRRPLTYSPSPLMAGDKRDSVAIVVRSKRGHELAVGRAFYLILGSNRLPFFHSTTPNNFVLASIRGIGLSCDAFCTVREQIQIILDFRRIPPETFTAGRTIRWRNHFISLVGDYVSARLRSRSLELLENQSKELAIIWKIFQDRSMPRSTRAEMLPVRTNDPTVTWQRWEEIESKYPRIVIVPFHIAWKGPWSLDVPCVGIPNGQIGSLNYDSNIGRTPIWDCNLVTVAGRCTGYLWPPAANVGGLELLSHRTTYLHDCLRSWPISITHKTFQTSVPIYPQLIQRGDLPSYDRDANPWEQFGILEYAHANDGSVTSQTATTMLDNSAPCNLSLETLEIDLDGTEDWE
jgi:hypothetical protein